MMRRNSYLIIGGRRVRIKCKKCDASYEHRIQPGVVKKNVRCKRCNKTMLCKFDHRVHLREKCAMPAKVVLEKSRTVQVHLHDKSVAGIGFITRGLTRAFCTNQKIDLIYRVNGKCITRKACVVNVQPGRVCAKYI